MTKPKVKIEMSFDEFQTLTDLTIWNTRALQHRLAGCLECQAGRCVVGGRVKRRQGYIDKGYTDLFVLVGASQPEAEVDYERLSRIKPEMFLGYNVLITGPIVHSVEGLRVNNYHITDRTFNVNGRDARAVWRTLEVSKTLTVPTPRRV